MKHGSVNFTWLGRGESRGLYANKKSWVCVLHLARQGRMPRVACKQNSTGFQICHWVPLKPGQSAASPSETGLKRRCQRA
eukprot:1147661-Pelagomonas_calceolata.AAC.1